MRIGRITGLTTIALILLTFFIVNSALAEDIPNNVIKAEFNIELVTATDFKITCELTVTNITLSGSGATYTGAEIETIASTNQMLLGAISQELSTLLGSTISTTFKDAYMLALQVLPTYSDGKFHAEYNVNLTTEYLGLGEEVNVHDFVNGVLDMGAYVNYSFNLQAKTGWDNTYLAEFGENLDYKRTDGALYGNKIKWSVYNSGGLETKSHLSDLQLKRIEPTTPTLDSDNIFLEFILDSTKVEPTSLTTNLLVKAIDIRPYGVLPSFVDNLDFIASDGVRLLVDNGFILWNETYETTIKPLQENIKSTIEGSSFNQDLDIMFSWDNTTTVECSEPYEISNMDDEPAIKAILTESDVDLKICGITSKALFGLINSGAGANITKDDVNFGSSLSEIGREYNATLYLPEKLYLDGANAYTWNETEPIAGEFESDIAPTYTEEDKDTVIEIHIERTDLNLLSFFTGKTEITFGLDMFEIRNYNVATLPTEFTLPEKISLDFLNADAFKLCVQENVFPEDSVTDFLENEKIKFENTLKQVIPNLEISANVDRDEFDESIYSWDGNISDMDETKPVKTSSSAHSSYIINFDLSFIPPGFEIPEKTFNFTGLPNQDVVYRMVFPKGITISTSDLLDKATVNELEDGRQYFELFFSSSESNLSLLVSCKMTPSLLFIIGIFMPCIVCLIIAIILIAVIYILRKKRKGRRVTTAHVEENLSGYEDEDYYIPPSPGSK